MKKKFWILTMTALLLAVTAVVELTLIKRENNPLSVDVVTLGGKENIGCWRRDGVYHLFLPANAQLSQTQIRTNRLFPLYYQKHKVENGTTLQSFPLNEEIWFRVRSGFRRYDDAVVVIHRAENTASLYIDTASGSMDYIHEAKGNEESGDLRLYTADGMRNCAARVRSIKGRGNSTWDAPKKPYSLELTTEEDLLGMGAAKKWILLANYNDPSNLCNKMGYEFAAATGDPYAPQCQWVDLYLNGDYAGLYLLTERNEVDSQRVDIPKEGSFLLSMEWDYRWDGLNYPGFHSERANFFRVHHAGMPQNEIEEIWQSAENAIYSADGIDPVTGKYWTELLDMDSWARQWLLAEVFVEYDAGALSQFLYYEEESGKIFAGPVWDLDNMLNFSGGQPANILNCQRRFVWNRENEAVFYRLYQQDEFRRRVHELYWEEYRPLLLDLAGEGMDGYLDQCDASVRMNAIRWSHGSPEKALERMKGYLLEHMAFLESYWGSEEEYCTIEVMADSQWRTMAVPRGEVLDSSASFSEGDEFRWINADTGEPVDGNAPVMESRVLLP